MQDRESIKERILERAEQHICTAGDFDDIIRSTATRYRTLAELREEGRLKVVGSVVMKKSGRPENVYGNGWKPKSDHLFHDVKATRGLLSLKFLPIENLLRGFRVDKTIRPDAEFTLRGIKFWFELDTGKQSLTQLRDRQKVYEGVKDFVLYVTLSERRLAGLLANRDDAVKDSAVFTTLDQLQASPTGKVWHDCKGNHVALR